MAAERIRPYHPERDLDAVERIWREVGWISDDDEVPPLPEWIAANHTEVGLIDDAPECAVMSCPGTIRYQTTDLPLCAVTAVTTSRIGRKQGFASTLTARALRHGADNGAAVAALGMFEQGFYDRLGFGAGPYDHRVAFDPGALRLEHVPYTRPVRLTADDHAEIHGCLARRHRSHGGVMLDPPGFLAAELHWVKPAFGLGYRENGRLTHFIYGKATGEHGPYEITHIGYEEPRQLLDLLRLMKEMADQVTTFAMDEPAEVQLQDLLRTPLRQRRQTKASEHATGITSVAWWQLRLLDLEACVAAREWPGPEVRFNLTLDDPVGRHLDDWAGVAGDYVVTIGRKSTVDTGTDSSLPTLAASVNTFSRCWFGVRPASSLALTDATFAGPPELMAQLDQALSLPRPSPGLDF